MWGASEEPPDGQEVSGTSTTVPDLPGNLREAYEDNKNQLDTFKDFISKSKQDLKKKEEELQEYASKLSEIKSRAKRSRRSKDSISSSVESTSKFRGEDSLPTADEDAVDHISQAKTPKAKAYLLQRKLAENRKVFEQRSKEITESKRAVEEKVEAIRQQMDQTELTLIETQKDSPVVTPVKPVLITTQLVPAMEELTGKNTKITELNNRILELEALVIDLQDNLKEKDSVIEARTKAVTLMSADLSKKGKSTLDTLEDTKDEMRAMQENFVLIETSLRDKNENLLEQLRERNDRVNVLEATINRYELEMEEKRLAECASVNLSRTTMDTLADTKDEMRTMQENFILIETSLREKNDNLLRQLEERETKMVEAEERIYKLESGAGITTPPEISDLQYRIDRLEQSNRVLQDEKYELQKGIVELQEKIVTRDSLNGNDSIVEKDNRIAELENLVDELKSSNRLLEKESKSELEKKIEELELKNDELKMNIHHLEKFNHELEMEKNELTIKISEDARSSGENDIVQKLRKELDDLNKGMIKLKAQHKNKLRNLQKQLDSLKTVSDTNAELVKLGNQVALLEEEKGNLQLSLVDFDELKASAGDWQERIADLESRVSSQASVIQAHIEAIAILENQKLELMQDLHAAKQEISALEAENAESENLRVTAEMKIVDMEEQLESLHKLHKDERATSELLEEKSNETLLGKIERLAQENSELVQKIAKLEEKASSEAGSTESFETINEDRNELMRKIDSLSTRNAELEEKYLKLEEATRSNVGSTESFETLNEIDKSELVKKIDLLSRENSDLVSRLNKFEEKGSSDTGSTESFEKIPEHNEAPSRIDILTRENNELVIKLTKLEEKMENLISREKVEETVEVARSEDTTRGDYDGFDKLARENKELVSDLAKLQEELVRIVEEKNELQKVIEQGAETKSLVNLLTVENEELRGKVEMLDKRNVELTESFAKHDETESEFRTQCEREKIATSEISMATIASLESEIEKCRRVIAEQTEVIDEIRTKLSNKEAELESCLNRIAQYETLGLSVDNLQRELTESYGMIEEWRHKFEDSERKNELLESGKLTIEEGLRMLQDENKLLMEDNKQKDLIASALREELNETMVSLSSRLDGERTIVAKQEEEIKALREALRATDEELHEKYALLQNERTNIDNLQEKLKEHGAQREQREAVIFSLNEEIEKARAELIASKEEISSSSTEISQLREELSAKASKDARNEEIITEMKTTLNERAKENESLRAKVENASIEVKNFQALLISKSNEIESIVEEVVVFQRRSLEDKIRELTLAKGSLEEKLSSVESTLEENGKYAADLKTELGEAYRMLELLKIKHTEDTAMANRRLEELLQDLCTKTSECEFLAGELADKEKLIRELQTENSELRLCREELTEKEILVGKNVTEQIKLSLEARLKELEEKLAEAEENTQSQLQKRKILAANLKKKSAQCEELEAKVLGLEGRIVEDAARSSELVERIGVLEPMASKLEAEARQLATKLSELEPRSIELEARVARFESETAELEERCLSEKNEKEAANMRIQETQRIIAEKSEAIIYLENEMRRVQDEAAGSMERADNLSSELRNSSERVISLTSQVTGLLEEIERLNGQIESNALELENEKRRKEELAGELESQRQRSTNDAAENQQILEEAKEKARELGVRMQVMESEYVEQLNTIQTLRTVNGILVSKNAHISERLENAEKEASERKTLLDEMQREREAGSRTTEPQASNEDKPPCEHCDQCQTVVQALQAKLQERDAEIENLDNELANSIGNFVHMRESLRVSDLMNQSGSSRSWIHEEVRDGSDLVSQNNALTARNAELTDQLNSKTRENEQLTEKIVNLETILREATTKGTLEAEKPLSSNDQLTTDLRVCNGELVNARAEIEAMRERNEKSINETRLQVQELESYNAELTRTCNDLTRLRNEAEIEVASLREESARSQVEILQLQAQVEQLSKDGAFRQSPPNVQEPKPASSALFSEERENPPKLFDANQLFGTSSTNDSASQQRELTDLRKVIASKDLEKVALTQEVERLSEQISRLESLMREVEIRGAQELENSEKKCEILSRHLADLEDLLAERNRQIESLKLERFEQQQQLEMVAEKLRFENEECLRRVRNAEDRIESLSTEKLELVKDLEEMESKKSDRSSTCNLDIVLLILDKIPGGLDESGARALSGLELEAPSIHSALLKIVNWAEEAKAFGDSAKIEEMEAQVARERDIKQVEVKDLARSLEELDKSMKEVTGDRRLRELESSLDQALRDNDKLRSELESFSRSDDAPDERKVKTGERDKSPPRVEEASATIEVDEEENVWEEARMEEEIWNAEAAADENEDSSIPRDKLLPNLERRLNARIAELEDTIRDLQLERDGLHEEAKRAQVRSGKLVKKLKEFMVQNESLQRQLKMQKATVEFCDLNTAIEEELKSQIEKLEKALADAREETRKSNLERDNLLKRIEVVSTANERLVEMKERQDMEVQLLHIRTKEMSNKIESMDWQLRESCAEDSTKDPTFSESVASPEKPVARQPSESSECHCKKYEAEIAELHDEIEALAAENEQLQTLLDEEKIARSSFEANLKERLAESAGEMEKLSKERDEMGIIVEQQRSDYQSLMDSVEREEGETKKDWERRDAEATRTREELAERVRVLEMEKERLTERTERLASLDESMTELTGLLNARVQEVAELKREIQRLKIERKEALVGAENIAQNHTLEISLKDEERRLYVDQCESRLNEQNTEIADMREKLSNAQLEISSCHASMENMRQEIERLNNAAIESRSHRESLQSELAGKEQQLFREEEEVRKYSLEVERLNELVGHLKKSSADRIDEANRRIREIEEREAVMKRTINELTSRESDSLAHFYREISEKDTEVAGLQRTVLHLEGKIDEIANNRAMERTPEARRGSSGGAASTDETANEEIQNLRSILQELSTELSTKNDMIEDYKYQLSESTFPAIIQALQDQVNMLYEEKTKLERSLASALQDLWKERELPENTSEKPIYHPSRRSESFEAEKISDSSRELSNDDGSSSLRQAEDEIQALKTEIDERIERFGDLHDRYENVCGEVEQARAQLSRKDQEILSFQQKLEKISKECDLLRRALESRLPKKDLEKPETQLESSLTVGQPDNEQSNELDIALYMLHQRDVRCEELTHELMQLLEERDTLQLRLSNAIRVNEELRRSLPIEAQSSRIIHETSGVEHNVEPIVEEPSPSRSVGPVEIAKEAIDSPDDEKLALAQKLSQLHKTGHRRDIRLMDDRQLRHDQQMSLLAHRDVLSTLPPEAAARLVNANYTLSRDVQSQSSILMNWLWGKSTPKVVHM